MAVVKNCLFEISILLFLKKLSNPRLHQENEYFFVKKLKRWHHFSCLTNQAAAAVSPPFNEDRTRRIVIIARVHHYQETRERGESPPSLPRESRSVGDFFSIFQGHFSQSRRLYH